MYTPKQNQRVTHLYVEQGLSFLAIEKETGLSKFKQQRILASAGIPFTEPKLNQYGFKVWKTLWTLEEERSAILWYRKTASISKTAKRLDKTSFQVATLLASLNLLLPKHSGYHRFYCATWLIERRVHKLAAEGLTCNQIRDALNLHPDFKLRVKILAKGATYNKASPEIIAKAIALYKQGVGVTSMGKHGIHFHKAAICRWLHQAGIKRKQRSPPTLDSTLLHRLATQTSHAKRWSAFKRLARRETEKQYRRNRSLIDPEGIRGKHFHLDHRVSVYKAFHLNWTPSQVASPRNLQILPALDNHAKYIF